MLSSLILKLMMTSNEALSRVMANCLIPCFVKKFPPCLCCPHFDGSLLNSWFVKAAPNKEMALAKVC